MFHTARFTPFMHAFMSTARDGIAAWSKDHMYLICSEQGSLVWADMFWVDNEDNIERDDDGNVWGIVGKCIFNDEGGVMIYDVMLDYTQFARMETAALRIQRTWRRRRMLKAAQRISAAFRQWQVRKNELWNPTCFVGIAHLYIEANRAIKEVYV